MGDVAGVSVSPSGRAQDMQMKCDFLNETLGQGHILFCTGTPVSNSMTELYVMTRYLCPDLLKAAGVERFDDWAATFGKVISEKRQTTTGELKMKSVFAKFANLDELMTMYRDFADIKSAKTLALPRPDLVSGKPEIVTVQASPEQRQYVKDLAARTAMIEAGRVNPHEDNYLKLTSEARLIGLGNRAVAALYRQKEDGELPEDFIEDEPSKLDACIEKVMEFYTETTEQKGVQIVFSDIAVNSDRGNFSAYDYIRDRLIAKGIPAQEIVYAPKADSKERAEIFRKINDGEYRVVIGSTGTIGTGANVQRRLFAIHNIDVPWKPADFAQREGRILRQGNSFEAVHVLHYVTEGTLDSYLYQTVTGKAKFIAQLLDEKAPARVMEDCDDKVLTFAELQAAAEGNPELRERLELQSRIAELKALRLEHQHEIGKLVSRIAEIPGRIERKQENVSQMETDRKSAEKHRDAESGKVKTYTVLAHDGKQIWKRDDIKEYLHNLITKRLEHPFDDLPAFRIGDFTVGVQTKPGSSDEAVFTVKGARSGVYYIAAGSGENADNWQRIANFLTDGVEREIAKAEAEIENLRTDLSQAQARSGEAFPQETELADAEKRLAELEEEIAGMAERKDEIFTEDDIGIGTEQKQSDNETFEQNAARKR